jgi:hypothetical protein
VRATMLQNLHALQALLTRPGQRARLARLRA